MNEQNKFYTSISKYYSEIFPYQPIQLKFVQKKVGDLTEKQILDIGCATGELALNLAANGSKVVGIDLNEDLLTQAKTNKKHAQLKFQKGDMLKLDLTFQKQPFDAVLCFGNTLVHLQTKELIKKMLTGVFDVLKPGGHFLMQILNYDYIIKEQVSELPLIETENIKFIRKYKFEKNTDLIRFQTDLYIKKENRIVSNETSLFALESKELIQTLENSGFKNIELFANFKQDTFGGKHLPLVLAATKD